MSNVFGFLLSLGFAYLSVDTYSAGDRIAAAIFTLALVATLVELTRKG